MNWFPVRFAAYLVFVMALFEAIVLAVKRYTWEIIQDGRLVENTQVAVLLLAALLLVVLAWRFPERRGLSVFMACLALLAAGREKDDSPWYSLTGDFGKWALAILLLGSIVILFRRSFPAEVRAFGQRPSLLLFLLGLLVAAGWAQVLARREIFTHRNDRVIEEALEMAGYFLILAGVFEEWLSLPKRASAQLERPSCRRG